MNQSVDLTSAFPVGPIHIKERELTERGYDLATASAFAGLLVAGGGGLVKLYKSRTRSVAPAANIVPIGTPGIDRDTERRV